MTHAAHRPERYSKSFEVRWADVDLNGHMRNTAYSEYGTDVRVSFFGLRGFSWERFREMGLGPVLLREETEYLRELGLGDRIRVDLEVAGLSPDGARWRVRHGVYRGDGKLAARVTVHGGFLDLGARKLAAPPEALAGVLHAAVRAEDFEMLPPLRRR